MKGNQLFFVSVSIFLLITFSGFSLGQDDPEGRQKGQDPKNFQNKNTTIKCFECTEGKTEGGGSGEGGSGSGPAGRSGSGSGSGGGGGGTGSEASPDDGGGDGGGGGTGDCPAKSHLKECKFPPGDFPYCYKKVMKNDKKEEVLVVRGCGLPIYSHIEPSKCQNKKNMYVYACNTEGQGSDACNGAQSIKKNEIGAFIFLMTASAASFIKIGYGI